MLRAMVGVIVGYVIWTVLWLGGNAVLFSAATERVEAGEPFAEMGPLIEVILLSIVCSLAAGVSAAAIARERARPVVLVMAALLLVTGVVVQINVWALLPLWYHLTFLTLIVPVCVFAGRLNQRAAHDGVQRERVSADRS